MTAVLVAGGAGYVGSHTCKALARAGYTPVTYDNLSTGFRELVRWGPLVEGDLADTERVRATLRRHRCEAVFHFAASAYVGESVIDPRKYVHNNVCNTASLLDAVLDEGVRRIVFSSTCAVYGTPKEMPLHEGLPLSPINPYGETKRYVEDILRAYGRAYGLGWAALRYFNASGADPDGEAGELHEPETHLLPLAIKAALNCGPSLSVMGTDYPTPDGTAIRDYVHVADLAVAHVQALDHLAKGGASLAANLGTGKGHSVLEVISAVERCVKAPVPHTRGPRREGDPPVLYADATLAKTKLGFVPTMSSIDQIVDTSVRWHRAHSVAGHPGDAPSR